MDRLIEIHSGNSVENVLQTEFDWITLEVNLKCHESVGPYRFQNVSALVLAIISVVVLKPHELLPPV